jgi:hypothetical protein
MFNHKFLIMEEMCNKRLKNCKRSKRDTYARLWVGLDLIFVVRIRILDSEFRI